ncbi:TlpA family protein disulfide reductase [Psychroserpens sp. Hel_I_66]|uniref:TlpA family protein disulfide reductase n=1 Tax=Psychroserpens sp. Hel_I_66 TaxID=1250004 RepID=UPI000646313C|nr:TlpA disulfide reductase family protein [Psychroserpens sp. Hel_I_66]
MKSLITLLLTLSITGLSFSQDELPRMQLKNLDGKNVELEDISKDQLVVISLWATWCVPCKNELDAINEVYDDWIDETNVKLYAISVDDSRTVSRVKPLVNGKAWDFEILLDTNNDLKRELGAATIPVTLIVKDGKILYRHSGYTPGSENELFEEIKKHS